MSIAREQYIGVFIREAVTQQSIDYLKFKC